VLVLTVNIVFLPWDRWNSKTTYCFLMMLQLKVSFYNVCLWGLLLPHFLDHHASSYSRVVFSSSPGSDPDRSSRDATDFMVVGNVDVTFEEDSMLMVDTDALFRGDVTIACDEDDVDDFDGRLLEEDEINAGGKDGLSRGKNKQRRLSHKSRKSCNDPPSLLAQQAKIQELKVDELQVAGTVTADTLTADTVTADTVTADTFEVADSDTVGDPGILTKLDSSGLFLAQGAIDTNGGGIDTGDGAITTGAGDITSTGTITAGTFLP
jgi:hypothetical protein